MSMTTRLLSHTANDEEPSGGAGAASTVLGSDAAPFATAQFRLAGSSSARPAFAAESLLQGSHDAPLAAAPPAVTTSPRG
eukprot:NODE_31449_length_396_cov_2.226766.p3 GENE.NODE_31449_length_396_cov_2.226766~~NODE_31449_length_396_cov_2.226766.p3  ORF type:complete len:80 (-),score=16.05 NODE_31449_length_396_cov_2.226766:3-242(-)